MLVASIENVTKRYRLGAERSNWRSLIPGSFGEQTSGEWFDALRGVTIEVARGESLGVIGSNGAGKSTLLKVLGGIVEPTSGTVEVHGRVASVIELGVGFNPELTGDENLEFAGALIGARPSEVRRRRDAIVEFAELEAFMDTPLKRYSTGMRARLGFALVTSFHADLLILDEVLSVGDWAFQRRCLERIRTLHREGAAIVFVSHSPWLTTQICDRAVLLENGVVTADGDAYSVVERYIGEGTVLDTEKDAAFPVLPLIEEVPGDSPVRISELTLEPFAIEPHGRIRFRFRIDVERPVDAQLVMSLYTLGRAVFADPAIGPSEMFTAAGSYEVSGVTDKLPFSAGGYKLRVAVIPTVDPDDIFQEHLGAFDAATLPFKVLGDLGSRPGLQWHTDWWVDSVGPVTERTGRDGVASGASCGEHPVAG